MRLLTKIHCWLDTKFGWHKDKHFWGKISPVFMYSDEVDSTELIKKATAHKLKGSNKSLVESYKDKS